MLLPRVSETLAGRIELLSLWPLSQGEIDGSRERFVGRLFAGRPAVRGPAIPRRDLIERIIRGGFPEVVDRRDQRRRRSWFRSYLTTIAQRDVRELADIDRVNEIPRLLASLAQRVRSPLNVVDISATLGIPRTTLDRYLTLLAHVFAIRIVPGWHSKAIRQLTRAPKVLIGDTGLLTHLLTANAQRMQADSAILGAALENFVGMELTKQLAWSDAYVSLFHLRTSRGAEVDFVLESTDGRIAAVEVKAAATVGPDDFKHLEMLRERSGDRFVRGVVLYTGDKSLPFGDRLAAWPLTSLWS
jgi:hypothetical protein